MPCISQLCTVHRQRISRAVEASQRGVPVAFTVRLGALDGFQITWGDGRVRHVIGKEISRRAIEDLRAEVEEEFARQLTVWSEGAGEGDSVAYVCKGAGAPAEETTI